MGTAAGQEAKKELRAQMKKTLSSLSEISIQSQSKAAQDVVLSLPQYKQANRIGIYLSMPWSEAQTDLLVRNALKNGKAVFVPHIYAVGTDKPKRKFMDMLRLASIAEFEGLSRDAWGIPKLPLEGREHRENAMGGMDLSTSTEDGSADVTRETEELDLIVVPGVAFDHAMNRLGHGAAFYDNFLTRFCEHGRRSKPYLVGMCLEEQVLPPGKLVMQAWDWKMDAVAVGNGSLLNMDDTE